MNFKEALIAHLQGEKVESKGFDGVWRSMRYATSDLPMEVIYLQDSAFSKCEFRIAQRTITVNGVEVPAPESAAPNNGVTYFVPSFAYCDDLFDEQTWSSHEYDSVILKRGLVYLNKEDAIDRAKAMLLTSDTEQELSVSQLAERIAKKRGYVLQSITSTCDDDKMTFKIECIKPKALCK